MPTDGDAGLGISEPCANVVRLVPRLPHGAPQEVDAQWRMLLPLIERALAEHALLAGRFANPVQWFYSPMSAPVLLGRFGARGTVYDCMDELANFRFAPPDIAQREQFLLAHATSFHGGYQLYQAKSRHHRTVYFRLRCGCRHSGARVARPRSRVCAYLPWPVCYVFVIDDA